MRLPLVLSAVGLGVLAACSSGTGPAVVPAAPNPVTATTTATATTATPLAAGLEGDLTQAQLAGLLLQTADLPELPQRRQFAGAEPSTQAPPQLALCHAPTPTAPHQLANVLAQGGQVGQVQVFEVLSVYADPAAAQAAYAQALADARGCTSYVAQGRSFTIEDLAEVTVPAGAQAAHYRLTTPDVVGGDVRTLAVRGRYVVLITGYGAPPGGQTLLDYQAGVLQRALGRLG